MSFDRNLSKLTFFFVEQDPELLGLPPLVQEHKGEVRLTWRSANLCVLGHHVKVCKKNMHFFLIRIEKKFGHLEIFLIKI